MTRKFYTAVDFTGVPVSNLILQQLSADPTSLGSGHIYFNTSAGRIHYNTGSGGWVALTDANDLNTAVSAAVAALVSTAPSTLNTLAKIDTAINNDASIAATLTSLIGTKLSLSGGTMTGALYMGTNRIKSSFYATDLDDVMNKQAMNDAINGGVGYGIGVAQGYANTAQANAQAYTDTKIAQEVSDRNVNIANAKNEAIGVAETYALGIVNTENSRALAAEALLAPKASPTFTGTVNLPLTTAGYVTTTSNGTIGSVATIPNSGLTYSSLTVGSTSISLGSSSTTLGGLTSVTSTSFIGALTGNATTVTNGVYTTDTGTVTNTMLAGSITNAKLVYSSTTLGSTALTLGATNTTITGLSSVTSTNFVGNITGNVTGNVTGNTSGTHTGNVTLPFATAGYLTNTSTGVVGTVATIPNAGLTYSNITLGTTSTSLGGTSLTLSGLTSVTATSFVGSLTGNATTVTNGVYTTDTGTVTNTMLAGSIDNSKLLNPSLTLGSTPVALGSTTTTLSGFASLTSTTFVGALTGNASTATKLATARAINGVNFDGSTPITIKAFTTNPLTIGTGLSGTSFDGSGAVTIAIDTTTTVDKTTAQTLTNKSMSGSSNTFTNIPNSALTNSSLTVNGTLISLGSSGTVAASTTNALTIGTGLTGTSFTGSSPVTIAIDTSVVTTLTGTQTLTNKTLTSPKINDTTAITTTGTELNYVAGVTSSIQTQLNAKAASSQLSSYQPISADLTAIAAISSGIGNLKRTGTGTWAIDTTAYLPSTSGTVYTSILAGTTTLNLFNTFATTINFGGAVTAMSLGSNDPTSVLTLNAPTIVGNLNYVNLYNTLATTVNFAGAATSLTIGGTPSGAITHNYSTNPTASGVTKTVNLATGNASGGISVVNVGSTTDGSSSSLNVNIPTSYNSTVTVPYPTLSNQAANKQYVDNVAAGIIIKAQVYLGTTGSNLNAVYANGTSDSSGGLGIGATLTAAVNGALTLDGILAPVNSRVIIKDQTDQKQNGVYVVTAAGAGDAKWVLTRASDFNGDGNTGVIKPGAYVFVTNGTYYANASYVVSTSGTSTSPSGAIKVGTDIITFAQYSGVPLNISTLGNVSIGTWQATPIAEPYISTAIARTASPTFTGHVTVPAVPTATTDAASKKYVDDLVLASLPYLPDIIPLDSLRYVFDGRTSRFAPKFQGIQQTLYNPYKLMITLNGVMQTPSYPEQTWLSLLPYDGFILDSDGYIAFSQVPPAGSTFDGRVMLGPNINTIHKSYPFNAVDVLLGI